MIEHGFSIIKKYSSKPSQGLFQVQRFSNLQVASTIVNGCLGLLHLCLGVWKLEEKLRIEHTALPLNWWLLELFQGVTWLSVGLTISLRLKQLPRQWLRLFSVLVFVASGIFCAFALFAVIGGGEMSFKVALDVLSFPGALLLLLCTYKEYQYEDVSNENNESLYPPLNGESSGISKTNSAKCSWLLGVT